MTAATVPEQLPTLPGKVDGIVGLNPLVLQCRVCGATHTDDRKSIATAVILSGSGFHTCDAPGGVRHCRDCLEAAEAKCGGRRHD